MPLTVKNVKKELKNVFTTLPAKNEPALKMAGFWPKAPKNPLKTRFAL
jgi:hypothetical protein